MNSVSKAKITVGYTLLLAVLLFSLFFVQRETEKLMLPDARDTQWEDSLLTLLREKDENTVRLLRMLGEVNDSLISTNDIEQIIARRDTVVVRQRVQQRVITRHDTIRAPQKKKKGFFRRLGEVFAPPKEDTALLVKTSTELAMDTVFDTYRPVDSLHEQLRAVARKRQEQNVAVQRKKRYLRRLDNLLNARIDSLLKGYERQMLLQAREAAEHRQWVRQRSARIVGGIAVGAVLLAAFFLVLIGRDVTRSNRYRRELEEARKKAEDLLAVREKLMLAITHDFKAPLGSIIGYADLLSKLTVDERQRFYLDNMKTSSEHLLKLVVDLLDFHRLDLHKVEVNRVSFQPSRLLEEVRVSFEPLTAAKELALVCQVAPELDGFYVCDPLRLRQIINNLLSNAIKFTDRGSVTLAAGYEDRQLVVAVTDTGRGMEPAGRERIFQEFTRLPGAQGKEGFGLGLSIVRMLVQLLEGTIEVESELGKGSTFTVRIPLYPVRKKEEAGGEDVAGKEEEETVQPSSCTGLKVLLIDDDRLQLSLTSAMFARQGIETVCCLQVDELLDALRTGVFDVLLTDVQMPAINGFDLLRLLRASNIPQARDIPVIAVTARSDMQHDDFASQGFSGCLYKPFTVQEFVEKMVENGIVPGKGKPACEGAEVLAASEEKTPPSQSAGKWDFSALTAFSGDDREAAKDILESFAAETRHNVERLRTAVENKEVDEMAAVAHKALPLCVLIGATGLATLLRQLESSRGKPFVALMGETAAAALALMEEMAVQVSSWVNLSEEKG